MSGKRLEFLIVDPQNDFCDPNGALYVPGAEEDSKRLAETIKRLRNKISHINVTLDTHRLIDIAHPIFWGRQRRKAPRPVHPHNRGRRQERPVEDHCPGHMERASHYVDELAKNNRYMRFASGLLTV